MPYHYRWGESLQHPSKFSNINNREFNEIISNRFFVALLLAVYDVGEEQS